MAYDRRDYRDKWRIERLATNVRKRVGIDQYEPIALTRLADAIPAHVFFPEDFGDKKLARQLATVRWDGFGFTIGDDPTLIVVLNPSRPATRRTATLLEEFSHHLLRHKPSAIRTNEETGLCERTFNSAQEHEAYDLGAAILLPKERIQCDVAEQRSARAIAGDHGCSQDLVVYRIKRMRLWQRYTRYAA